MNVLMIDGYNMLHRCRYGMGEGDYSIVFTFFRSFRALVEKISPDKVIFALEGHPGFRYQLYPAYKANRKIDESQREKIDSYIAFKKQKKIIVNILNYLPIEVLCHPDYEGDDVIGKLVKSIYQNDQVTVVTGDTDFYQLLEECPNVKIYNPLKKEYVTSVPTKYILHKSLVGDTADNIAGIPKVGPKTAIKLIAKSEQEFESWLDENQERREILERNLKLIKFADVPIVEIQNLHKEVNFDYVKEQFKQMNFKSLLNEKTWNKFVNTFSF